MKWRSAFLILLAFGLQFSALGQTAQSSWEDKNHAGEKAFQEGKLGDATRLFYESLREAQQFGSDDVRLAPIYNNLALVAFVQNSFIASEGFYDKAIAVVEKSRGREDVLLLPILDNLTRLYVKQWAFGKAIQAASLACRIREKKLGPDNPDTTTSFNRLATLYLDNVRLLPQSDSGTSDSAAPVTTATSGEDNLSDAVKLSRAEELYRKVLASQEKTYGSENARLVDVLQNLGEVLHGQGKAAEAEPLYTRAIAIIEKSFTPDDLRLVSPLGQLAELKAEDGKNEEAESFYQRALQIGEKKLGPADPSLHDLLIGYAALLEKMQKPEDARNMSDRVAALADARVKNAVTPVSQTASVPYVLRFERSVFDRYSGVHQMCLLVRADGKFRIEDQQHAAAGPDNLIVPGARSPDGMNLAQPEERLDMRSEGSAHPPSVYESSIDPAAVQQLAAILSAKGVREIQGSYPQKAQPNGYDAEKITVSILRDGNVQNFIFPDVNARQPYESSLKPIFKWIGATEKRKGPVIKGAAFNNCSPELPQSAPLQFGGKRVGPAPGTVAAGANSSAATSTAAGSNPAAASTAAQLATFKVNVNLVLVRVVVRDAQGRAVGTLHQDDFHLLDNRKPQTISKFALERLESAEGPASNDAAQSRTTASAAKPSAGERNLAFLFDDIHSSTEDIQHSREAAGHFLANLPSDSRAAVFTTSGTTTLDFTNDRTVLHDALQRVQAQKTPGSGSDNCPEIDGYMADLIRNHGDEDALGAATAEALVCGYGNDARFGMAAEALARTTANNQAAAFDRMNIQVLQALQNALRRLDATPGQHTLILVSSGFVTPGREQDFEKMIDAALRAGIVISTLDTRGLYHLDSVASNTRENWEYRRASAQANAEILSSLAEATGGTFFHNSNDLDEGFRHVTEAPEYSYVLGFAPNDQELDGKFHPLTVELSNGEKLKVQARKGYYAPKKPNK